MSRDAKLLATMDIDVADIRVDQRLRPHSEKAVASLIASIEEIGLQAEIHVRKVAHQGGILRLIAGLHRIEAFKRMGRQTIPCKVWDCTDDWARMAEIDDNLAHTDLSPLDLAIFLAERKAVYERMYPEAKHGGARGNQHTGGRQNDIISFCQSAAEKIDKSVRHVEKLVAAGQGLEPEAIALLRTAPRRVSLADLQELAKCEPGFRTMVCRELSLGKVKSVKQVLDRQKAPGASLKNDKDTEFRKLNDAFARASKATRMRFVDAHREALAQLLAESAAADDAPADVVPFKARERG